MGETIIGVIAFLVGMEIGWVLRRVQIRQELGARGVDVDRLLPAKRKGCGDATNT